MKNNIRFGILAVVLLFIYHLLVFMIPFVHNSIFWLSYGFTLVAFVIAGVACWIAFRRDRDLVSKFFGYPVAKVGIVYLVVQMILSFVFMILAEHAPIWLGILVYAIALAVAVIGLVVKDTVRDHILIQDINLHNDVRFIRSAQSKLNQMTAACSDKAAVSVLKKLAEDFRYSDPVSTPALAEIEADLTADINELQNALIEEDFAAVLSLCKHAQITLLERNRLCKLNKKKN